MKLTILFLWSKKTICNYTEKNHIDTIISHLIFLQTYNLSFTIACSEPTLMCKFGYLPQFLCTRGPPTELWAPQGLNLAWLNSIVYHKT